MLVLELCHYCWLLLRLKFETFKWKTDVALQPSLASELIFITIFFILSDFVNKCRVILLDLQINDEFTL